VDRDLIHNLARMLGSPTEDKRGNVLIRCPLVLAPTDLARRAHPRGMNSSPSLSVKVEPMGQSVAYCHACNAQGSLLGVFREAQTFVGGLDHVVAFLEDADKGDLLAAFAKIRSQRTEPTADGLARGTPGDLDRYIAMCSRYVPRYLVERRGIVQADVERWRLGYDPDLQPDKWAYPGAATFPSWDERGFLVGCSRRTVNDGVEPKFFDWPGWHKEDGFYGEHLIDTTIGHGFLVEGVMGTIKAARVLPNTLGVLGASVKITPLRLAKLRRWFDALTLVFDSDVKGRQVVDGFTDHRGNEQPGLAQLLRPYFSVKIARLPTVYEGRKVKDPDDIPASVLVECAVHRAEYLGSALFGGRR
jgi:hypothetical protein